MQSGFIQTNVSSKMLLLLSVMPCMILDLTARMGDHLPFNL